MSADIPEMGDVWVEEDEKYNYRRMVWISLVKDAMVSGVTDEGRVQWCCSLEYFLLKNKFLYKSKASVKDLFCIKENAINVTQTDLRNIDDMKVEINRLREALKEISRNKTTEEQQGNPDYVDEDGDLIGDFEYAYDEFVKIARKALNGESEG